MKRKLAILICGLFLASGLVRIGAGVMMIGQAAGWWTLAGEAAEALTDTQRFIREQPSNLIGFTPISYFAFIVFMGLTISVGAIAQMWRRPWGLALICVYLLSQGLLFVNFMTINRKAALLALAAALTAILAWANRPPPRLSESP